MEGWILAFCALEPTADAGDNTVVEIDAGSGAWDPEGVTTVVCQGCGEELAVGKGEGAWPAIGACKPGALEPDAAGDPDEARLRSCESRLLNLFLSLARRKPKDMVDDEVGGAVRLSVIRELVPRGREQRSGAALA
jgi:hypothetical protein